jgi:protein phosphatase
MAVQGRRLSEPGLGGLFAPFNLADLQVPATDDRFSMAWHEFCFRMHTGLAAMLNWKGANVMNLLTVEPTSNAVGMNEKPWCAEWISRRSWRDSQQRELAIRAGGCSVKGRRRAVNQDCFYYDPAGPFLVADGMGGMQSGEVASTMAIDVLSHRLAPDRLRDLSDCEVITTMKNALMDTNREILAGGEQCHEHRGMGTTIVVGLQREAQFYLAHVGDSRAYRLRSGVLELLTVDHTMAQSLLEGGAITPKQAACHPWRHVLWNALGGREGKCKPDLRVLDLLPGDRFLLTTDGLTSAVSDEVIRQTMCSLADPIDAAQQLVDQAVSAEASDDATCVAIYFDPHDSGRAKRGVRPSCLEKHSIAAAQHALASRQRLF